MVQEKDEQLYRRIQNRDREALEALYDRYEKILFSFIMRFTNDAGLTEEIIQDLFIKLWSQKAKYDSAKGKFSSWLLTLARNASIDNLRKKKKEVELMEQDQHQQEDLHNTERSIIQKEENDTLHQAVQSLPKDQQKIVHSFYFEGETQNKISETFKIPLGTVKSRIRLALKTLRKELAGNKGRGEHHE
jgi:RNA polymerase sigma-70 factor (family 1)